MCYFFTYERLVKAEESVRSRKFKQKLVMLFGSFNIHTMYLYSVYTDTLYGI